MRRRLHIFTAILSCCFLYLAPGCGDVNQPQDAQNVDHKGEDVKVADQAPVSPTNPLPPGGGAPIVPPGPGVVGPGGGGGPNGGGSQGGNKPARTGNDDDDVRAPIEGDLEAFGLFACADGIDNDGDGLVDCADPNCGGRTCNDGEGCTIGDTCLPSGGSLVCVGTQVNCEELVGNECSIDVCMELNDNPGDTNFVCESTLAPPTTSCTPNTPTDNCPLTPGRNPDGTCPTNTCTGGTCSITGGACTVTADCPPNLVDACLIGSCDTAVVGGVPSFVCEEVPKVSAPTPAGCADGNPCTGDMCNAATGACEYFINAGTQCSTGNPCSIGTCDAMGTCGAIVARGACTSDADCDSTLGSTCVGGFCTCADTNPCTNETCNATTTCVVTNAPALTPCSDGNPCTTGPETCNGTGTCTPGPASATTCPVAGVVGAPCPVGVTCLNVTPGTCSPLSTNPGAACTIDADCPGGTCDGELNRCGCTPGDGVDCTTDTCAGAPTPTCVSTPDDAACPSDDNPCTNEICTATGCSAEVLTGTQSCVFVDTTPDPDVCYEGSLTCTAGTAGPCTQNQPPVVTPCPAP